MTDARKPIAFKLEAEPAAEMPRPRRAPRAVAAPEVVYAEAAELNVVVPPAAPAPLPRRWRWSLVLASALTGLVSLYAGLAITRLIDDLFTRWPLLGWIAFSLACLAAFAALAIIIREAWSLLRLRRISELQGDAARALNMNDEAAAKRAIGSLRELYAGRADAAWGLTALKDHDADIIDGRDRVKLADRVLVVPLDEEAHRIIARAARRIAMLTAITPAAALDMIFVAAQCMRMAREIATLYGGRPSALASFRLARMIIGHLAVTGGVALSDGLIQHTIGKGLIGRLSARFGEGAVNGILTARVGLAARDVCRPIPQEAQAKDTLASLVKELFSFSDGAGDGKT